MPNHVPACWILRLERGASGDIAPSTPLWRREVFAQGDILHLRRDYPLFRVVHLRGPHPGLALLTARPPNGFFADSARRPPPPCRRAHPATSRGFWATHWTCRSGSFRPPHAPGGVVDAHGRIGPASPPQSVGESSISARATFTPLLSAYHPAARRIVQKKFFYVHCLPF